MTQDLERRIADLRRRAAEPCVPPVPWPALSANLVTLRRRLGEDASTLGLAVDGWITAAEDEWPPEVLAALTRLGWEDKWAPRSWDPRSVGHLWNPAEGNAARGFVSGAKGTLFEEQVADRVASGELRLPDGG